jgi:hypothetical protein
MARALVGTIADDLVTLATGVLADLGDPEAGVAPGLVLPATLAGHRVDADAHADLVFTLGLLRETGVRRIGDLDVEAMLHDRLAATDARRTHTFFSYRIAETAARLGGLDALAPATRDVVVAAADSTEWIPLLDEGILPRNYAVVLARCELARARLGLDVDPAVVDGLVARVAVLLGESPEGWLDDSQTGRGQVDMYTVDAYLFAEPFADRLGDAWARGLASAARLVDAVVTPGGAALPWGRSIGALAVCHSAELAALLLRRAHEGEAGGGPAGPVDPDRWWSIARTAADGAGGWFDGGLVVAHKRRAPFRYRGPFRRLQMTLDCVGKLVSAALDLRRAGPEPAGVARAAPDPRDEWLAFGEGIGVWAHRTPASRSPCRSWAAPAPTTPRRPAGPACSTCPPTSRWPASSRWPGVARPASPPAGGPARSPTTAARSTSPTTGSSTRARRSARSPTAWPPPAAPGIASRAAP